MFKRFEGNARDIRICILLRYAEDKFEGRMKYQELPFSRASLLQQSIGCFSVTVLDNGQTRRIKVVV
jgi:hypothetical protein